MMDLTGTKTADSTKCQHCGAHVTAEFRRIFSGEDGLIHRCLACDSTPRLQKGSAAGKEVTYPDPQDQHLRNRGSRVAAADGGIVGGVSE